MKVTHGFDRHCEERSDEAIYKRRIQAGLLRFARNDGSRQVGSRK